MYAPRPYPERAPHACDGYRQRRIKVRVNVQPVLHYSEILRPV